MTARCKGIMQRKNSDYTGGENATDALANFKASAVMGIHPAMGLLLRVQDKMKRIQSFVADGKLRVTGESVQDACDDILNYAILCAALLQEESAELSNPNVEDGEPENELTKLPDGFVLVGEDTTLHHRPAGFCNQVMYQTRCGDWVFFDEHAPTYGTFAVKVGTPWEKVCTAYQRG